jgi:hypothetical protein
LTFADVTAEAFSCAVPTLFFGKAETAAKLVPPSARASATHEITSPGEGRRTEIIGYLPLVVVREADDRTDAI